MLSLKNTADRILNGTNPRIAIKEHVDAWNRDPGLNLYQDEPMITGIDYIDAWLAAAAEYEAFLIDADCPDWVLAPSRFLKEPFIVGGRNTQMMAIVETPFAFRRRMLFTGKTGLITVNV